MRSRVQLCELCCSYLRGLSAFCIEDTLRCQAGTVASGLYRPHNTRNLQRRLDKHIHHAIPTFYFHPKASFVHPSILDRTVLGVEFFGLAASHNAALARCIQNTICSTYARASGQYGTMPSLLPKLRRETAQTASHRMMLSLSCSDSTVHALMQTRQCTQNTLFTMEARTGPPVAGG